MVYIDTVHGLCYIVHTELYLAVYVACGNFTAISLIKAAGSPNLLYLDPSFVLLPLSFHPNS